MNAPPFVLVVEGAGSADGAGFWRGVARRFTARSIGIGVLVSVALALVGDFALIGRPEPVATIFRPDPVLSFMTGHLSIFVAVLIADEAVARGAQRWTSYALAIVAGAAIGAVAQWHLRFAVGMPVVWVKGPGLLWLTQPAGFFFMFVMVGALAVGVYVNQRTALAAIRRMHAAEQARAAARRRTIESRLQAMQARVEPAFLFDTLARVRDLYEVDAGRAGTMLDDLITYLRAALPHLRESTSTLGREVELVRAFVDIVRAGLDRSLQSRIDVADTARDVPLPAMLLLPLVQHGLQRSASLCLDARRAGATLRLEVEVDSDAFVPGRAHAALDALRERLRALYADTATLAFAADAAGGSRARLELPLPSLEER
jgi:hypothetical protein